MRLRPLLPIACLLVLVAAACAPDLRPDIPATPRGTDAPSDVLPSDALPGPGTVNEGGACTLIDQCAEGLICAASTCVPAPECRTLAGWTACVSRLDDLEPGLGEIGTCINERCLLMCNTDADCSAGSSCTDFGRCRPFDGTLEPWAETRGELAPLRTGYGEVLIDYPIGVPLGGYGDRSGGRSPNDRYTSSLRASAGTMHGMQVRAVALDTGERQLLLISIPVIFIGADIHEAVARMLQEHTGRDWRDDLIINATHTHSGPARLWPLPERTLIPLGILGIGDYSEEIRNGMIRSLFDASAAALDDLQPGRFGWSILEAFDTDDALARHRWSETPRFDDNRLLFLRFDDENGDPRAVVVSYGVHGTVNGEDFASNDVMTGVERQLEAELGQRFDRVVPVLFVNQNSGSMSPANAGQPFPQALERSGHVFADRFLDELLAIETSDTVRLRSRTYRFPITYEGLGYEPGEFRSSSGEDFRYGALQCVARGYEDDDAFENVMDTSRLNCLNLQTILFNQAPTQFLTSHITVATVDGLTLVTMPGELTMAQSWTVLQGLEQAEGVDPLSAWTLGYSQDHHLYLTPTRVGGDMPPFPGLELPRAPSEFPEFAFSWLRGGYEQGMSTWGWRFGDFLVQRAIDAYRMLQDPDFTPAGGTALPRVLGNNTGVPPFAIDATPASDAGRVIEQPPATVQRFEPIEFSWIGGDPGAEAPQTPLVTLEREVEGTFESVMLPSRRAYDNREYRFMTRWQRQGTQWRWVVRWEELKDFPAGTYRFRVDGHYATTENDRASRTPYQVHSEPFTLVPTDTIAVDAARDGNTLTATVTYPGYERLTARRSFDSETGFIDSAVLTGHFRLRDPDSGPGVPVPLRAGRDLDPEDAASVTVTTASGDPVHADVDLDNSGDRETLQLTATLPANAEGPLVLTVTDRWGNTGRAELP